MPLWKDTCCGFDGFVDPQDFKRLVLEEDGINLTDAQVQEAIDSLDLDGDSRLSLEEVIAWMIAAEC